MTTEPFKVEAPSTGLEALAAPSLDPIFWRAERIGAPGRWWGHVPFAHWIVCALRPRTLVELGINEGISYSAFCQAVARANLNTRCYAVHVSSRDEELDSAPAFESFHDERYTAFSTVLQVDANAACGHFLDGTIDLLHVDRVCSYEMSRQLVSDWMPRLSANAVLLLHGTNPRDRVPGVRRLWGELSAQYGHFEFLHGDGLGMLAVGAEVPPEIAKLCRLTDPAKIARIRDRFAAIGDRWERGRREMAQLRAVARRASALSEQGDQLRREVGLWELRAREEERARRRVTSRLTIARRDLYAANLRADESEAAVAASFKQAEEAIRQRDAVLLSKTWRMTDPLRRFAMRHPRLSRFGWRALRLAWWTVTLQLVPRYRDWRQRPRVTAAREPADSAASASAPHAELETQSGGPPVTSTGQTEDSIARPDPEFDRITEARTALLSFLASSERLQFDMTESPDISVVVALRDQAHVSFRCLAALCAQRGASFEVLAVQNRSSGDDAKELLSRVDGIRIMDEESADELVEACSHAVGSARGRALLFLHGAACLRQGAIATALTTLDSMDNIGAVGARIVLSSGMLLEAGGIIWSDAGLDFYGRSMREDASEVMFRREVDFVDTLLLTTRAAWRRVGGYDTSFRSTLYSNADYCMRLRDAGYQVVYEPRAIADMDVSTDRVDMRDASGAVRQSRCQFRLRHGDALHVRHLPPADANRLAARECRRPGRQRLLMIDAEVPFASLGAGYPRAKEMLAVAAAIGWSVTLYPLRHADFDRDAAFQEFHRNIEIVARQGMAGLRKFLEDRKGFYEVVLVSRPDNMDFVRATIRDYPSALEGSRLIYDAEAVFAYRDIAKAALDGNPYTAQRAKELCLAEAEKAEGVDAITCVTDSEASFFRAHTKAPVYVVNHPVAPTRETPPFAARKGFLFVGRLLEHAAPNWQGLSWFIRECWPKIRAALADATLTVVGHLNADHTDLEAAGVRLMGPACDLRPYYDSTRVFIAPVRFAAGVPIKVLDATAGGLPTVSTRLMARQLGWHPGVEIAAEDDVHALAAACVLLHQDEAGWEAMRAAATARLQREFNREQFTDNLRAVLTGVPPVRHADADREREFNC